MSLYISTIITDNHLDKRFLSKIIQMKKYLFSFLFVFTSFLVSIPASAQVNSIGELMRGGIEDSNLLLENYLKPYTNGFGAGLNTGWNNSARPYRTLGFDLRVNASLAFVPVADEVYDVARIEPQFTNLELFSTSGITPTIAGEDEVAGARVGQMFTHPGTGEREELYSFELPQGTGFPMVPTPMIQGTVGIPNDTDISLRLVPSVSVPNAEGQVSLFGIGAKHGLNQWIPGGKVMPIDISLQFGYTQFNFDIEAEMQPESGADIRNDFHPSEWEDQRIELKSSGYTANLLIGRNLPILSVFAGVGFQSSTMEIITKGSYPITAPNINYDPGTSPEPKAIEALVDPIDISFEGDNSVHALAGFRVRLGFIAISASYTISDYPVANVGIGFSMR
ncbi:hypothetical protein BH23BAC3_BH23BAC3_02070 [soil metagenome]